MADEEYIGFLKYEGTLVEDGLLDARKAADALLGFDEAIRFFVGQQSPALREQEFEIPVRLKKGSWEALIPITLVDWLITAIGIGASSYFATAGKKLAENDIDKKTLKDVFTRAIEAIQWMIRIGKHLGNVAQKKFEKVQFRKDNTEIGIANVKGEILFVPKLFLDLYSAASPKLLKKLAGLVEIERRLNIGVFVNGNLVVEDIPAANKGIFTGDEHDDEILFPELIHGQEVSLEGHITRGNENTNSLGFMYRGHILACHPESGSVVNYKSAIFVNCRIFGTISRLDRFGGYNETKPKILFQRIEPLDDTSRNPKLL